MPVVEDEYLRRKLVGLLHVIQDLNVERRRRRTPVTELNIRQRAYVAGAAGVANWLVKELVLHRFFASLNDAIESLARLMHTENVPPVVMSFAPAVLLGLLVFEGLTAQRAVAGRRQRALPRTAARLVKFIDEDAGIFPQAQWMTLYARVTLAIRTVERSPKRLE